MKYVLLIAMCLTWNNAHAFDWATEEKAVGGIIAFFHCKDELDDYYPEKVEKFLPVANEYGKYLRDAVENSSDIAEKVNVIDNELIRGDQSLMCTIAHIFMEGYLLNEFE